MQDLLPFIDFIQKQIEDENFKIQLSADWASIHEKYRIKIREHLGDHESGLFSRQQWAELYNLHQRPQTKVGSISISHCQRIGGYAYSKFKMGFDVEEVAKISDAVITRTSSQEERARAPHLKFLWVAKEAAFKALHSETEDVNTLILTDLICKNWLQTSDLQIWSYQINSAKKINTTQNIGYVFSVEDLIMSVFFK